MFLLDVCTSYNSVYVVLILETIRTLFSEVSLPFIKWVKYMGVLVSVLYSVQDTAHYFIK